MSPEGTPVNAQEIVDFLRQREKDRRIHALGDETLPLLLEVVAIQNDEEEVAGMARDLRIHLIEGGKIDDFLTEHPQHEYVNFGHLMEDVAALKQTLPPLLAASGESAANSVIRGDEVEVAEGSVVYQSVEAKEIDPKLSILMETYEPVRILFTDENYWYSDDESGNTYTSRVNVEELFKHNKKETIAANRKATFTQTFIPKWKEQIQSEEFGRRIPGKGVDTFYTTEEVTDFLYYLHENLGNTMRSPYRLKEEGSYEGKTYKVEQAAKKKV